LLGTKSVGLAGHAGTQLNNIYDQVGFGSLVRGNGYATVESSDSGSPLFTYAAEADNKSGDLILIVGAQDIAAPLGFNAPTATPTSPPGGSGPTPTPTPTQSGTTVIVNVGQSGTSFSPSTAVIQAGDTVEWDFKDSSGYHSTTSGTCTPDPYYGGSNCSSLPSGLNWDSGLMGVGQKFSQRFTTAGSYRYYCSVHGSMMTGTVQVNP
jgi:plastocyanin